jgi:hypothetical protein
MSGKQVTEEKICAQLSIEPPKEHTEKIKQAILSGDHNKATELKAAFYKTKQWSSNETLNVVFENLNPVIGTDIIITPLSSMDTTNGPIDPLQAEFLQKGNDINIPEAIEQIVQERLAPLVGVKIKFRENPTDPDNSPLRQWDEEYHENEIVISFIIDNGACSYVGNDINNEDTPRPTMNLGWFDVSTVIHEFCHALGMVHEHQNPYGVEIDWNLPKLYQWAEDTQQWNKEETDIQIVNKYKQSDINGSSFDPCSVMLYFYPADLTDNDVGTNQNLRLSPVDMTWLAQQYPGGDFNGHNSVEEFYLSIYSDEDSDGFDDKMLECKNMATKFGDPQPIEHQNNNIDGFFNKTFNKENRTNTIIGILVILVIIALLLK